MGTSDEAVVTDKLGRRSGPRRRYSLAEKRAMVEETQVHGASVPEVAQRHGVNPNLLSIWRCLYRQGLLEEKGPAPGALLPVKVSTPTVLPTERVATPKVPKKNSDTQLEVEFASGHCLRIRGAVDRSLLRDLISVLSSR
jgi:transposase-like protein